MKETALDGKSPDMAEENIQKLRQIFPEAFAEGKVDFEKLQQLLGEYVEDSNERYNFTWNGKGQALRLSQTPSLGTLRPCKEESKDWDTTQNLYIEGDNLEVLKLLQKSYHSKIKMIYIDPPYNTGKDFVYPDNFRDGLENYKKITGQVDGEGNRISTNTESSGRYHTDWLNMMYPRLRLARNLLTDDGVIFISIDDNEVDNLKKICNEVFGEDNFIALFPWRKRTAKSDVPFGVSQDYEWILMIAKSSEFGAGIKSTSRRYYETDDLPNRPWRIHDMSTQRTALERPNSNFTIVNPKTKEEYPVNPNAVWRVTKETIKDFFKENRIVFPGDYPFLKIKRPVLRYFQESDIEKDGKKFGFSSVSTYLPREMELTQKGTSDFYLLFENKAFPFPKPVGLIKYLTKISTFLSPDSIILDFFSGSATTAHAVMELNAEIFGGGSVGSRKFIMVQLPEPTDEKSEAYKAGYKNICEIGKERIRRAGEQILELSLKNLEKEGIIEREVQASAGELSETDGLAKVDLCAAKLLERYGYRISPEFINRNKQNDSGSDKNAELSAINSKLLALSSKLSLDVGFKVLKLDTSNIRRWQPDFENIEKFLEDYAEHYVEGRTELDIVYEIMLKYGLDLRYQVDEFIIADKKVYSIGFGMLMICLDDEITIEVAKGILDKIKELAPESSRVLFKDNGFDTDSNKTNVKELLKCGGIEEFVTL